VRGSDRAGVLARARAVADAAVVEGVPTSLPAVRASLADLLADL
jgi:hypothetical protein